MMITRIGYGYYKIMEKITVGKLENSAILANVGINFFSFVF